MSIPFRFKAGSSGGSTNMAPINHHHRSTTKVDHKPFKSRFATKSALKDQAKGKIESRREDRGKRKTPHQQIMSKLARRNQAKQLRMNHKEKQEDESSIFKGVGGAAKHVALIPLSSSIDVQSAIRKLNESVELDGQSLPDGTTRVRVDRFHRNLVYLPAKFDMCDALDVCKLADWVVFVLEAEQEFNGEVDMFLRAVEGQGITSFTAVVQDVENKIPLAKRSRHLVELKMALGHYLPTLEKISNLDSKSDCASLVRNLCTASTRGIRWRDDRCWMLVEGIRWGENPSGSATESVVVTGTIRGRYLNPDRLVHVPGWGDFRMGSIRQMPIQGYKRKADEMVVDQVAMEWGPSQDQEDLAELAPETVEMTDTMSIQATNDHKGVLVDDHHYFSDDNSHIPPPPKKLPQGTSSYQAAWYLDDVSDSASDYTEEDPDGDREMNNADSLRPEDGVVAQPHELENEAGPSEYPESEMHIDANDEEEARQLEEYRSSRKTEAQEDLEFPDEIELHPGALARERLTKYRGLKSLRTSEWNNSEDAPYEPLDYKRLLQIADYKKSANAAMTETLAGGVPVGLRVEIELQEVPVALKNTRTPSSLFVLLRHEHKHAVINLNLTLHSSVEQPVRSKEELIVQIGHRRLAIHPVFSASGQTPNDVHKFDRFIHPGRTAIATFTGPMTWGSVPVLVFKRKNLSENVAPALVDTKATPGFDASSSLELIGTATTIAPSHSRVIAKRVILTGHPFKIHKKLVTVRYMFFNREDVSWFAALPLWTKRGRQGFIKESLGTHGYFKATFDGKINPMDAVGVSLYKRVWPRPSRPYEA